MSKYLKQQIHIGASGYPVDAAKLPERQAFRLTKAMVLRAVATAISPYSNYINDMAQRAHQTHVNAGGKGFPPRTSLVLARLNALADEGLLEKSRFANGYYGFHWTITPAGRRALAEQEADNADRP